MVMVSASVVPHHHHEGAVCVSLQHNHGHEHESGCVADAEYTDKLERDDDCNCDYADCRHGWHLSFFTAIDLFAVIAPDPPEIKVALGEPIILYHSIDARTGGGLRAPPAYLC